ncbi:C-C chemokine receptor type 5-like isoform X2 [Leuresthes tenuis]|uniref:C-C chemokine receptor type 5-like isoform X2 n=1 Tax=Leuresthes tenuis TaxID=355514 RepID=UPI003B5053DB
MNFTNDLFISSDNGFTTEAFPVNSTSFIPEAFPVNSTSFIPEAFPVNSTSFIPEAFPVNSTSFIPEAFPVNITSFITEAFPVNITSFITEAFPVNITSFITEAFTDSTTEYYYDYPDEDFGRCVYERHGAHFLPPLYAIFFLLGLLGNSLVIWVIACGVRLRSMTDVCLLNLAIADLLLVCSLPFLAHQARDEWLFGDVMCRVVLGIYHIVFYCGIFFVCLMSIDRYLAIVHAVYALKARTRSFGMIAAAITWVAGIFASFPEVIFLKQQTSANMSQYCFPAYPSTSDDRSHFWRVFGLLKMNIVGLLVPLSIIIFCYSQIVWRLLYSHSSKKQAIRVVFVVVAVFFCCWVPYNIASFFKVLDLQLIYTGCERSKSIRLALQVTEAIAYSHSCLNPILYVFVGEKFRRQLLRLINRASCRLCQVIKVYIPQDMITASVYSQPTSMDERSTGV